MRKTVFSFLLAVPMATLWAADTAGVNDTPQLKLNRPEISAPANLTVNKKTVSKGSDVLRRIAASGKVIQGYQTNSVYGTPAGMYRFNTDAATEMLYVDDYTKRGYSLTQGWMREGRLCATAEYYVFSLQDLRYLELDPFTGEVFVDRKINFIDPETQFPNYLPYYYSSAYDKDNDRVYGYGCSENGMGYAYYSAPGNDPAQSVCLRTPEFEEICTSIAYNPTDGNLYGINRNNDFVRIAPETGVQEVVMPTGLTTKYAMAGMMYVESTGKFILNTVLTDYSYGLAEIDPVAKSVTQLCYFDNFEQFPFLYMLDTADDPNPIKCPEVDDVKFSKGSNSGYISYFLPSEYFAGGSFAGELNWYASVDGVPYSEGTATAGDVLVVDFSDIPTGMHTFDFYVAQDSRKSSVCSYSRFIGYDVPNPTASVTLSESRIEWQPVTRCVNNGYLDPDALKYHVYINDEEIGITSDTYLDFSIASELPYASYTAKVVVDNSGQLSESMRSNSIVCGAPWTPDFLVIPTAEQARVFSAFDIDQDKSSWSFIESPDDPAIGSFYGSYSSVGKSDDWLFSPPILLDDATQSYEVSYEMGNFSSWCPDIEVGVYLTDALDPKMIVTVIQEQGKIANISEYIDYARRFTVESPGVYYLAFNYKADIYELGIRLKNIGVKRLSSSGDIPCGVSDLKVEAAPKGDLKAIVSFTMPDRYISDKLIPESVEIGAEVILGDNSVVRTGAPGEHVSLEIPSLQGLNQVSVKTFIGTDEGNALISNVYTGVDVPGPVSSISGYVTEDNLSLVAQWTAPTEGENGYYINPDDVVYNLMVYGEEGWEIAEVLGKNVYEYTYTVPEGSVLATTRIGIAPSTVAGVSGTVAWLTDALGTPYSLPLKEEFENANFKYGPIRIIRLDDSYSVAEWGVLNPRLLDPSMEVPSEIACYGRSEEANTKGMLMLPKFNLENVDSPAIVFDCWTGYGAADVTIYGETFDSDGFVTLGKFPVDGDGWQTVEFPFPPEFADHKWVAVYIDAYFKSANHYALFSSYEVRGGTAGVKDVNVDNAWIRTSDGAIKIEGFQDKEISIHSLDGIAVWLGKCNSDIMEIKVPAGIYAVHAGGQTVKVVVK